MALLHLLLLAAIEGIAEALPVSAAGHRILLASLAGPEAPGPLVAAAVRAGTLGAVLLFFRRDVAVLGRGARDLLAGRLEGKPSFLALCLLLASLPVAVAGLALALLGLEEARRSPAAIGAATLGFGLLLLWADRTGARTRVAGDWTLRHALALGLWQALGLIPGASRTGVVVMAARRLGYGRREAARLSLLMGIPVLAVALALDAAALGRPDPALLRDAAVAAVVAFGGALGAVAALMRLLPRLGYAPFALYRCALGAGLLVWAAL